MNKKERSHLGQGAKDQPSGMSRRTFLALSAAASPAFFLGCGPNSSSTFTILHMNDLHSNLIGVGPASEYSPTILGDDQTVGGIARIATLIQKLKKKQEKRGPVLALDIGDFTIGTAFGGATQQLGAELQCLALAGIDITTLGNHEFDNGPAGLAESITAAKDAGNIPAIVASNTDITAEDPDISTLKRLKEDGTIRRSMIIDRGGLRFGLFGIMGPDSIQYTVNPGAVTFPDTIETAKEMARQLRSQGADIIICMSHGGVVESGDGSITSGDDITLAQAVPEIDVIVGGHTHTLTKEPIMVNGTPIVQAGCYGKAIGELVLRVNGSDVDVISYELHQVDDSIQGDDRLNEVIGSFTAATSRIVFEPRNLKSDEVLAIIDQDWPNTFANLEASLPIGNLTADAIRKATGADVALNAAGMVRAGLVKGSTGMQTAYDLFLLAPLGIGVNDHSAGGSLIKAYLTGREIKNCLEFLLIGNPNLPGQYFPRVSGIRFKYDSSRPKFDWVTSLEIGDLDSGYQLIDFSEGADQLYSVGCNLFFGLILKSIPDYTKGKLSLVPKTKDGSILKSRVAALPERTTGAFLLPPKGTIDPREAIVDRDSSAPKEIKEWEAIMNYIKGLDDKTKDGITLLNMNEKMTEDRSVDLSAS